jgi:hypothetical protein
VAPLTVEDEVTDAEVVAVAVVLVPLPEVLVTSNSSVSLAATVRFAVMVHEVVEPLPVIEQLDAVAVAFL